jgi:hypothetical protein
MEFNWLNWSARILNKWWNIYNGTQSIDLKFKYNWYQSAFFILEIKYNSL